MWLIDISLETKVIQKKNQNFVVIRCIYDKRIGCIDNIPYT